MGALVEFTIPIKGLGAGNHQFDYQVDRLFLQHFPDSPVTDAAIQVLFELEKKPGLLVLNFDIKGTVRTTCDRCLAEIDLPVSGQHRLLVKQSAEEVSEDPDVVFLHPEATTLEVAPFVYEFVLLSIPMIQVYDCEDEEPLPCNEALLDRLYAEDTATAADSEEVTDNPIWEELKKIKYNQ